ncbi:MAG: transcriptional regulator [Candidatus Thorarchaeota archaeon]|jgi:predicted transcriptional regulator
MRPPCETIVAAFLPAIRSIIARELVENQSMSQVKAAELLGTTQPAISQYLTHKRGDKLTETLQSMPEVKQALQEVVENMTKEDDEPKDAVGTICNICMSLRRDGTICVIHQGRVETLEDCDLCQSLPE